MFIENEEQKLRLLKRDFAQRETAYVDAATHGIFFQQ